MTGSGTSDKVDGRFLSNSTNTIVVSINYRLGQFKPIVWYVLNFMMTKVLKTYTFTQLIKHDKVICVGLIIQMRIYFIKTTKS